MQQDPRWSKLTNGQREQLVNDITMLPPVFSADQQPTEEARQWLELAEGVKQGNPEAEQQALALIRQGEWASNTGVAGKAIEWLSNTALGVADNLGIEVDEQFRAQTENWEQSVERGTQAEKEAWQYFQNTLANNANTKDTSGRVIRWAPMMGAMLDIGLGATVGAPVRTGIPNLVRNLGGNMGAAGQKLIGSWVPNMIESGYDAGMLTVSSYLQDKTEGLDWKDAGFGEAAVHTAQTFGEEFLLDFGFFTSLKLLGKGFKSMRHVFNPKGFGGKTAKSSIPGVDASPEDVQRWVFGGQADDLRNKINAMPPGAARESAQRTLADLELAKQFHEFTPGSNEYNRVVARAKGLELSQNADETWTATKITTEGTETVGTRFGSSQSALESGIKRVLKDIDDASKLQVGNIAPAPRVKVSEVVEGSVKKTDLDEATKSQTIKLLSPDETGKIASGNVKQALRNLYKGSGVRVSDVKDFEIARTSNKKLLAEGIRDTGDGKRLVFAPEKLTTGEQHENFLKNVLSKADDDIQKITGKKTTSAKRVIDNFETEVSKAGVSPVWTKQQLAQLDPTATVKRSAGKVSVETSEGTLREFADMRELNEWLTASARKSISKAELQKHLTREHGLFLKTSKDGTISVRRYNPQSKKPEIVYGKETGYQSVDELLSEQPGLAPKLPVSQMPELTIKSSGKVTAQGNAIQATPREALEIMSKYQDPKSATKTLKDFPDGKRLAIQQTKKLYRVEVPEMNFKRDFTSMDEARQFLQQNVDEFDYVDAVGYAKGIRAVPRGKHIVAQHALTGEERYFSNFQEFKRFVAEAPQDPAIGRELTDLPEYVLSRIETEISNEGFKLPEHGQPAFLKDVDFTSYARHKANYGKGLKPFRQSGYFFRQVDPWVRDVAEDIGDPKLYQKMHNLLETQNLIRADMSRIEGFMEKLMRGTTASDRKLYLSMLGSDESTWRELAENLYGKQLDDLDLERVRRMRDMLNAGAKVFNVDGEKFVKNYLPRMKGVVDDLKSQGLHGEAFEKAFKQKFQAKEIDFFAKHMRDRDLVNYVDEADVQEVLEGYFRAGYKNLHMSQAYDEAVSYVQKSEKLNNASGVLEGRMMSIINRVRGYQSDALQESINEATEQATRRFFGWMENKGWLPKGKTAEDYVVRDPIGKLMGTSIMGLMAGRPWLPVRNMQQVWSTLAPRVGNDTVWRAIDRVNGDPAKYMREMTAIGTVRERLPIYGVQKMSRMNKATQVLMGPYMNSDHYTRAVVAASVEDLFEKGMKAYEAGNLEQFMKQAGIDNMHPQQQEAILRRLQAEGPKAAQTEMTMSLTNDTMFSYRRPDNPAMFQGAVGRIFGQFGHYPTGYIENIRTGLFARGPVKAGAFISRAALNFAALTFFFQESLGINNASFNPLNQMVFTGGPYYDLAMKALNSISPYSVKTYGVDGTIGPLMEEFGRLVPGVAQASRIRGNLEKIANGDRYEGFLGLMSFPAVSADDTWFGDPIAMDIF